MRRSLCYLETILNDLKDQKSFAVTEPSTVSENSTINLSELFSTLWRGKIFILCFMMIAILLGGIYVYLLATPKFRSVAVLMLNSREESVVDIDSVIGGLGSDSVVINTEVQVLQSRLLLGQVVDDLNLTEDPEFNPFLRPPTTIQKVKRSIRGLIQPIARTPSLPSETRMREATINSLLSSLTISNVPQSLVFNIVAESEDREKSARIADTAVKNYINNQLEVKFEATQNAANWLANRVSELQETLEEAENEVKQFRAKFPLVGQEMVSGLEVQVNSIRDRITEREASQAELENRLINYRNADTPQAKAAVADDVQLQQLLSRIDSPEVQNAFDQRFELLSSQAQAQIEKSKSQLASLRSSLAVSEAELSETNANHIILQQLLREAEASRLLYEHFLGRLKETSAQEGIQQADSRVISPAVVPVIAAAPRKKLLLIFSAILGLTVGAAFVLFREARANVFRTLEQLEWATGYTVMGQIPQLPIKRRKSSITYLKEKPTSAGAEAIRNLRTSVIMSSIDNPPQVLMVSSSLPGEGKTTLALALSQNIASMGKRVLLIEGDIRRRAFSNYMDTEGKKGLMSVLSRDDIKLSDVIIHDEMLGADVLLGEKGNFNAADIFSSQRFSAMLNELRSIYDMIVIDTPPVLVVPDARIVAQHVDASLFSVRWDFTEREQVIAALREFAQVGHPVTGLVLNGVDPKGMQQYGYGYANMYKSSYYTN